MKPFGAGKKKPFIQLMDRLDAAGIKHYIFILIFLPGSASLAGSLTLHENFSSNSPDRLVWFGYGP
jgi:hypothetical protein